MTEAQIDEEAQQAAFEYVEWWYERVDINRQTSGGGDE